MFAVVLRGGWRSDPGGAQKGVLDLTQPLLASARTLRVGWGTVFGTLAVKSIFVEGIKLT